ncbi:hypothetical protein [Zobellia alginiliquefaciens]|uniref:hypothetical protein n=1 Tax=Zobellia alginiliquefaciens TaxID=3032586 RepID=UPI0023E3BE2A|nr:hypothetical protein [Zobellia alginiliquefaciens]
MKTTKTLFALIFVFFLSTSHLLAQESKGQTETTKEKSSIKEVDQINQASGEINETSANTAEAVKGTVSNTKETFKELGSLFGSNKEKGVISIGIKPITYDDPNLNALYNQIKDIRGVKNPNKNFSDNSVKITAEYKDGADALWQNVTSEVRAAFKMVQMGNDMIVVKPADQK